MKQPNLRAWIGRMVHIRYPDGEFTGKLLGKLDAWREARPDLVTAGNRHVKLWAAIRENAGRLEEIHFDAAAADVSLGV